VHIDIHKQIS